MAGPLAGYATFPGVNALVECHVSITHGISASQATIVMAPQNGFNQTTGDLVMTFDDKKITLKGCKVDQGSFQYTAAGLICQITLHDRRWKWAFGAISGRYNVHREPGWQSDNQAAIPSLVPGTEQSPTALIKLCFAAMGETGYKINLAAADDKQRPEVNWDGDVPAEALARLCDQLGCRVVFRLDDTVQICKVGAGKGLPTDALMTDSGSANLKVKPDYVGVLGGPVKLQCDFDLIAVGLEVGGQWTPIDQLSYRPAGGWTSDPWSLMYSANKTVQYAELARLVYRCYQIVIPAWTINIPGWGSITNAPGTDTNTNPVGFKRIEQIVLQDEMLDRAMQGGIPLPRPPMVYGVWYPGGDANCGNNVQAMRVPNNPPANPKAQDQWNFFDPLIYKGGFSIDSKHGIVTFPNPLFTTQTPGPREVADPPAVAQYAPAQIRLRTSFLIRDPKNLAFVRYYRSRATGAKNNTEDRVARHDEIVYCYVARRSDNQVVPPPGDNNTSLPDGSPNPNYNPNAGNQAGGALIGGPKALPPGQANNALVDSECDYYLSAMLAEYNLENRETIKYAGLRSDIDLDGAIAHIVFDIDAHGATTSASYNDEQLHRAIPFAERRRLENLRGHDLGLAKGKETEAAVKGKDTLA